MSKDGKGERIAAVRRRWAILSAVLHPEEDGAGSMTTTTEREKAWEDFYESQESRFMQPTIECGQYWRIETTHGTEFVDADMFTLEQACSQCVEGEPQLDEDGKVEAEKVTGYCAYLSAPGYLDRTDYCVFDTLEEAQDYLVEAFGEE